MLKVCRSTEKRHLRKSFLVNFAENYKIDVLGSTYELLLLKNIMFMMDCSSEAYSELSQVSKIQCFAKIVLRPCESSILDAWQGFVCVSTCISPCVFYFYFKITCHWFCRVILSSLAGFYSEYFLVQYTDQGTQSYQINKVFYLNLWNSSEIRILNYFFWF